MGPAERHLGGAGAHPELGLRFRVCAFLSAGLVHASEGAPPTLIVDFVRVALDEMI